MGIEAPKSGAIISPETGEKICFGRKKHDVKFGGSLAFRRADQQREITVTVDSTLDNRFDICYNGHEDLYDEILFDDGYSIHIKEKPR